MTPEQAKEHLRTLREWHRRRRAGEVVAPIPGSKRRVVDTLTALRAMPYADYLQTEHWKRVRSRALRRACYRCQLCSAGNCSLNVHHNSYDNLGNEHPNDLIVLCADCHAHHHNREVPQ